MLLSISSIRTDGGTQPRGSLDYDVIESYQDAMENGAVFPAIDVFYDGTAYWLADGFHRLQATYQSDREDVECTIHQGTLEDAQWFSFGANKANGLYRSNADKQRAVQAALKHLKSSGLSDGQIAKHCGVSSATVGNWREKLSIKLLEIGPRTVTRGGTTYQQDTTNIGKRPQVAPVEPVQTFAPVQAAYVAPPVIEQQPEALSVDYSEHDKICEAIGVLSMRTITAVDLAEYITSPGWIEAIQSAKEFLGEVLTASREGKKRA